MKLQFIAMAMAAAALAPALPALADHPVHGTRVGAGSGSSTSQDRAHQEADKKDSRSNTQRQGGSSGQDQSDSKPYVRPPS